MVVSKVCGRTSEVKDAKLTDVRDPKVVSTVLKKHQIDSKKICITDVGNDTLDSMSDGSSVNLSAINDAVEGDFKD